MTAAVSSTAHDPLAMIDPAFHEIHFNNQWRSLTSTTLHLQYMLLEGRGDIDGLAKAAGEVQKTLDAYRPNMAAHQAMQRRQADVRPLAAMAAGVLVAGVACAMSGLIIMVPIIGMTAMLTGERVAQRLLLANRKLKQITDAGPVAAATLETATRTLKEQLAAEPQSRQASLKKKYASLFNAAVAAPAPVTDIAAAKPSPLPQPRG